MAAAVREVGPLGIMVNAAGVLDGYASAEEIAPALWERVIGINLTGTFFGCKRALAEMLRASEEYHQHRLGRGPSSAPAGARRTPRRSTAVVGLTRQLANHVRRARRPR